MEREPPQSSASEFPLSKVSGFPMKPVPPCLSGEVVMGAVATTMPVVVQHDWAPELINATSFGLVLQCRLCGRFAQAEVEPPAVITEAKPRPWMTGAWAKRIVRRLPKGRKNWHWCPYWKAGDKPNSPNAHRWPDHITEGPVACSRCGKRGVIARIYDHPWSQDKVRSYPRMVPR